MNPGEQIGLYGISVANLVINGQNTTRWVYNIAGLNRGAAGSGFSKFRFYTELPAGSTPNPGNQGLIVYDASSNITFDSNRAPLWLGDVYQNTGPISIAKGSFPYYSGISIPLTQPSPPNSGLPYTKLLLCANVSGFYLLGGGGTQFTLCPRYRSDGTAIDYTPWRTASTDYSGGPASVIVGQFLALVADAP